LESNTEEGEEQDDYDTKDVKIEQDEEDEDDIDLKSDPMARSKALEEFLSESPKVKRMIEMFEEAQKRSIDDETDTVEEAQKRSIDASNALLLDIGSDLRSMSSSSSSSCSIFTSFVS
jgi:hypothetical protein